ncbi:hypothetical protein Q6A26_03645 [Xanthomonas euvesicatoria pv. eucalypti]|uniref:hypothetical protein n=2 Tax=Xanthomonas euvesicatoria TaxID=456327 RepID=UPI0026E18454|nr:hypothetical protein [Xanthomonas euvesicatoria]MDO7931560.1 hypothetical protein [Xanthomonas euvesicatoria pv. eucalypti]MDO7935713.1 hypothetical protein [Xanthomonas euvesicatoria pv. eucalypti]MDO7951962.1 hypothetical protein [Xanthomonas euvesicatoria pv. eucalypti]MDO7961540.1 hypothetical protein [Xanthomonas euvesicatoria pv. eucalypti]
MASYQFAAWTDALGMAEHIAGDFASATGLSLNQIRRRYEGIPVNQVEQFETDYWPLIADYLAKTEGQRPGNFRKVTAKVGTDEKIMFLVMCLLAGLRASKLLELRDEYRMVLAPGSGNRSTAAGAYRFLMQAQELMDHSWPYEAFEALGLYDDDDDDDDDDE